MFGGRRDPSAPAHCLLQTGDGVPLYLALTEGDLAGAARALAAAWRFHGVRRGDHVLIYDYGTSPATLFASWCYVPRLKRGAADLIGATPICNDGLGEFAPRAVHVLRYLRPRVVFVDVELMPLLVRRASDEGADIRSLTELIVVSSDEEAVEADSVSEWAEATGVQVRTLLRSGQALLFAPECERGRLHVDRRFYHAEVLGPEGDAAAPGSRGTLAITNRFLRGTSVVRHATGIDAAIERGRCPCGRPGIAVRCLS